jgi:hypothetical protein
LEGRTAIGNKRSSARGFDFFLSFICWDLIVRGFLAFIVLCFGLRFLFGESSILSALKKCRAAEEIVGAALAAGAAMASARGECLIFFN